MTVVELFGLRKLNSTISQKNIVCFLFTEEESRKPTAKVSTRLATPGSRFFLQEIKKLHSLEHVPDIQFLSLFVSTEELLSSLNSQDQDPDDPSTQDCQCAPRDFFVTSLQFRQVFSRLPIRVSTKPCQMSVDCPFSSLQVPVRTPPTRPQTLSRKEFDDHCEEVSSARDVVNWTPSTGYLVRLPTKHIFF